MRCCGTTICATTIHRAGTGQILLARIADLCQQLAERCHLWQHHRVDRRQLYLPGEYRALEPPTFPQALANISVRGNVIRMVRDTLPENVTFSGNIYYLDSLSGSKRAYLETMTLTQWQAAGHDIDGDFLIW